MSISDVAELLGVSTATLKRFLTLQTPMYLSRKPLAVFYRFSEEDVKTIDRLMNDMAERSKPIFRFHRLIGGW